MDDAYAALLEENGRLHEKVRQLLDALAPAIDVPPEWRLTATEARLYAHLASRKRCTKPGLHGAAYGHLYGEAPPPEVVESHISKMRRKLQPFGIRIRSERFAGYWIEECHGG